MYTRANKADGAKDVAAPQQALNRVGASVAIIMSLMLGAAIGMLSRLDIPQANHDILLVLVTALATNVTQIVSYFFGSSSSNKAKDDAIQTLSTTAAKAQDALAPLAGAVPSVPLAAGETVNVKADPSPTGDKP